MYTRSDETSAMVQISRISTYLGAIRELMRRKVDFAKGALPNQPAQGIVSDVPEVLRRELSNKTKSSVT